MRIAVIEDEKELAAALKKGLEAEDYTVDLYSNGASAREALAQTGNHFDVIVLDLMLPDESGAIVCSDIRTAGVRTPILVLTARDSTDDKVDLLDRGADDFLSKPFDFDELLARIRALSRRAVPVNESEIVLGELRVVPGSRMVYRLNMPISLTAREFDLLLYLLRHSGQAIDRAQLLARVWK